MKKGIALLLLGMLLMLAAPVHATNEVSDQNKVSYWCEQGYKIDDYEGGPSWVSDVDAPLVVLKSATNNDTFFSVTIGDVIRTVTGKDISHIIVCLPSVTTTTTVVSSTTTTTIPPTTTTTSPPTTTTTIPTTTTVVVTTTTVPQSSTTTSVPSITTTTTTTPTGCDSTSVLWNPTSQTCELPFTGVRLGTVFTVGAVLLALGLLIMAWAVVAGGTRGGE